MGGGVPVKRTYTLEEKSITAKLIKDPPLVDSEHKILIAIEGEVLLELEGDNDCEPEDILVFARNPDLKTMKKLASTSLNFPRLSFSPQ